MRVHVQKKHIVEYGSTEAFNHTSDSFHYILDSLGCSATGCDDEYAYSFEVDRLNFKAALDALKKGCSSWSNINADCYGEIDYEELDETLKSLNMSRETLIKILEGYYKDCDKHCDYMHFNVW